MVDSDSRARPNLAQNSVNSPEAFAHTVAYRAVRCVQQRERELSARYTPTDEDCAQKLARHLEIDRPSAREPLDELVHQENRHRVRALLKQC